ncbi:retinoschisin-like [Actinia tenebrosa]|uniref:Retinoschisin-like n=1 Tax=Actinia tenebrosa TaxID=6105 RepID=A0A6P8HHM0_ACTTE|nr:retinoschisin-like [Actinia tenebrosa]XP_031554438.1 retinoschisin-like [Actinia tenebrosa]
MTIDYLVFLAMSLAQSTVRYAQFSPPYDIPAHVHFDSFNTAFGWVLKRHVIKTLSNIVGIGQCMMQCSLYDDCYSLNFYPNVGVCELNSATHASHPGDYVPSDNGSFLLYIFRSAKFCDDSLCTGDQVCLLEKDGVTRQCKDCAKALGMEDRSIPDSAIMSSSTYGAGTSPSGGKYARLHNIATGLDSCCWAPAYPTAGQYLQVDLGQVKIVKRVATQGRDGNQVKYVTKYTIKWSIDGQTWEDHKENDVVKVFDGNVDHFTVVTNSLKDKIITRYIRLVVQEWYGYIELRMELYGCTI